MTGLKFRPVYYMINIDHEIIEFHIRYHNSVLIET